MNCLFEVLGANGTRGNLFGHCSWIQCLCFYGWSVLEFRHGGRIDGISMYKELRYLNTVAVKPPAKTIARHVLFVC